MLVVLFIRAGTLFFTSSEMTSLGYSMVAGVYVCVLALALVPGTAADRAGRIPVLRFFGRYSYGLYIWHQLPAPLFFSLCKLFTPEHSPADSWADGLRNGRARALHRGGSVKLSTAGKSIPEVEVTIPVC